MFTRDYLEKFSGKLDDEEWENIQIWAESVKAYGYKGAIGGGVDIELTPTSIGTFVSLVANAFAYHEDGTPIIASNGKQLVVKSYYNLGLTN